MNASDEASRFEISLAPSGSCNPASSLGHLSSSTLSMRTKKHRKRTANAQHNCNFHAGYVPVTEDVLHRSGIRGRKRYFLYCILVITLVVSLVNTAVTGCLLYVLSLTHNGFSSMEIIDVAFQPLLHFFAPFFVNSMTLNGVPLGSQFGGRLGVQSQQSALYLRSYTSSQFSPNVTLEDGNITVVADSFKVKSEQSKKWLHMDLHTIASEFGISNFYVNSLSTKKVQMYKNINDLYLESSMRNVKVNGSEAVDIQSMKDLEVTARNVVLKSKKGIVFQSKHSVYLDPSLPKVMTAGSSSRSHASKICICGNGQLFLVSVANPSNSSFACNISRDLAVKVC